MKKVSLLIALAALVTFAGCKKDKETTGTTLKASIEQNQGEGKTSLNPTDGAISWTAGDQILVSNGGTPVQFALSGGEGTTNGTFTYAGEFEINENTKAVYPKADFVSFDGSNVSITLPDEQTLTTLGTFANGANPMMGVYNGEGLSFTSLCGVLGVSLTGNNVAITGIEIVSNTTTDKLNGTYSCTTANPELAKTGEDGTNSIMLNCDATLTADAQEFYFVLPVGTLSGGFTMNIYGDGSELIFRKTTTKTNLAVELNKAKVMSTVNVGPEYVDLGLPNGTLWATSNVGTLLPEAYGDYFAWGETTTKTTYNWSTYQYCNGSSSTLTKYCSTDNLTTLQPEDDAATVNWGSDWRMPTKAEWQELYQNTTHIWTTQNGVNGRLFTASNGNSLFLPAAACIMGDWNGDAGVFGDYWSSSLYTDYPVEAWYFYFGSGNGSGDYGMSHFNRSYGNTVRPVRENN